MKRLENQRDVIADVCVSVYPGYENDYVSSGFSYSEPKEIIGPDLAYLGQDDDKIGPWSSANPDGQNDGHFQVRVYFPREVEVKTSGYTSLIIGAKNWTVGGIPIRLGRGFLGIPEPKLLNPNRRLSGQFWLGVT